MVTAQQIIARLGLKPLPGEGGFFAPTWVSASPSVAEASRPAGTAIYFMITPDSFSAFHRLTTDEVWHFYAGSRVEHVQLLPGGDVSVTRLGPDILAGDVPQLVVPAGTWQGARVLHDGAESKNPRLWSLLGCTMAPGWDEREWELGRQGELIEEFPSCAEWVEALTRAL
jgi:hypothetical protein